MNACIQPFKQEATRPAGMTSLQQQASFDDFVNAFNVERPHEAIMKRPAEVHIPSGRLYQGLPQLDDPFHDKAVIVTTCGRIGFNTRRINLSQVFAGHMVGIKQVDERVWLVSVMHCDLGYFDDETCRLEPSLTPSDPKCYLCLRNNP